MPTPRPIIAAIVGAVAVHINQNIGVGGRLRARQTGEPITAADRDNFRAGRPCPLARAVAAAAVGDDDAIKCLVRQSRDHRADRFRFVKCRDDDGDGGFGSRSAR